MAYDKDIVQFHENIIQSMDISQLRQQSRDNLEQSWSTYRQLLKSISQLTHIPSDILNNYIRTIAFLSLITLLFPLNVLITLVTYLFSSLLKFFKAKKSILTSNQNPKRILISPGRLTSALHLSRALSQAGHQIVLIDESINWLIGHRWSNSVETFYVLPSSFDQPDDYLTILTNIVRKEKIDLFIPVDHTYNSKLDEQIKSSLAKYNCSVFYEKNFLDDQYTFIDKARSLNLSVARTLLFTSRQDLFDFDFAESSYICRSLRTDYSIKLPQSTRSETIETINKLILNEHSPFILQENLQGQKYSTYGVCRNGQLKLFACFQSNFKHIEHREIFEWCCQYVRELNLTGQFSIDFIVNNQDRKVYALDCNSSGLSALTLFYNHPNLGDVYLSDEFSSIIRPLSTAREIYWFPNELWMIIRNLRSAGNCFVYLKRMFSGKEAIWSSTDPLPFLFHYYTHFLSLLLTNIFSKNIRFYQKIDFAIGKLV